MIFLFCYIFSGYIFFNINQFEIFTEGIDIIFYSYIRL